MTDLTVYPCHNGLRGAIQVPGDKSISHRALMLAGLTEGTSRIRGWLPASDCYATRRCMQVLGVDIAVEREVQGDGQNPPGVDLLVRSGGRLAEPDDVLNCGGSGTTARLLAGLLAGQPFVSVLTGNAQLRRRPMGRVTDPLRRMGATILGREEGRWLPLAISGGALHGMDYVLPVASGQVKSALILAGLFAQGETTVREPGPGRDHSERMLRAMGADVRSVEDESGLAIRVRPLAGPLLPFDLTIPGDPSSAAFLAVAAALVPGSEVMLPGVGLNPTRTGWVDVLRFMGASITVSEMAECGGEPRGTIRATTSRLQGTPVAGALVPRMIDEFPIVAVAATQAEGCTEVRDAAELRVKESDRIAALVMELRRMGAHVEERADGFVVEGPTRLHGATVDSHGDHRLAMSLAVAGLIAEGETRIRDVECMDDSFPGFVAAFRVANVHVRIEAGD